MSFTNERNLKLINCVKELIYSDNRSICPILTAKSGERIKSEGTDRTGLEARLP